MRTHARHPPLSAAAGAAHIAGIAWHSSPPSGSLFQHFFTHLTVGFQPGKKETKDDATIFRVCEGVGVGEDGTGYRDDSKRILCPTTRATVPTSLFIASTIFENERKFEARRNVIWT